MFDCNFFQNLKAEGINRDMVESIQQRIVERENKMHEQAASMNVFLSPTTFNR